MTAIETNRLQTKEGVFQSSGISLSIPTGQITAIIGPNGSGKSTLLQLIAKLQAAESGSVLVHGKQLNQYSRAEFAKTLSMLPQFGERLPEFTVRELVSYGRAPHRGAFRVRLTNEDEEAVDWAMKLMSIRRHEDRMVGTLSGGERQKVLIAMVLAQKTGIILLDEPTASLDIAHQLDLMRTLTKINREYSLTIVMVLHDLQLAAAFCQHLIAIKEGEIVARGAPQTIITSQFLRTVYDIEAKVHFDEAYPVIIPELYPDEANSTIFLVKDTFRMTKGGGEKLIESFNSIEVIEAMLGFIGLEILLTQNISKYDEVSVITRWSSKADYIHWSESEAFETSPFQTELPEYKLTKSVAFQELKVRRMPTIPLG